MGLTNYFRNKSLIDKYSPSFEDPMEHLAMHKENPYTDAYEEWLEKKTLREIYKEANRGRN